MQAHDKTCQVFSIHPPNGPAHHHLNSPSWVQFLALLFVKFQLLHRGPSPAWQDHSEFISCDPQVSSKSRTLTNFISQLSAPASRSLIKSLNASGKGGSPARGCQEGLGRGRSRWWLGIKTIPAQMLLLKQLHTSFLEISPRLLFPNCHALLYQTRPLV